MLTLGLWFVGLAVLCTAFESGGAAGICLTIAVVIFYNL